MKIYQNRASKMKLLWCQEIFLVKFVSKMDVEMNFRIITKNHAAGSKIGTPQKSSLEPL